MRLAVRNNRLHLGGFPYWIVGKDTPEYDLDDHRLIDLQTYHRMGYNCLYIFPSFGDIRTRRPHLWDFFDAQVTDAGPRSEWVRYWLNMSPEHTVIVTAHEMETWNELQGGMRAEWYEMLVRDYVALDPGRVILSIGEEPDSDFGEIRRDVALARNAMAEVLGDPHAALIACHNRLDGPGQPDIRNGGPFPLIGIVGDVDVDLWTVQGPIGHIGKLTREIIAKARQGQFKEQTTIFSEPIPWVDGDKTGIDGEAVRVFAGQFFECIQAGGSGIGFYINNRDIRCDDFSCPLPTLEKHFTQAVQACRHMADERRGMPVLAYDFRDTEPYFSPDYKGNGTRRWVRGEGIFLEPRDWEGILLPDQFTLRDGAIKVEAHVRKDHGLTPCVVRIQICPNDWSVVFPAQWNSLPANGLLVREQYVPSELLGKSVHITIDAWGGDAVIIETLKVYQ